MSSGDVCPECRGIKNNPAHYRGEPVTDALILRCVLYEAFTLAITVQTLLEFGKKPWPAKLCYELRVDDFDPQEVLKTAALMKIRLLSDFLYSDKEVDDFDISKDFSRYGFDEPLTPKLVGLHGGVFTKKSINKFVAHLAKARIEKPKCIPQPRFEKANQATLKNAMLILHDVKSFASQVESHQDFPGLEDWGQSFLDGLRTALARMEKE